MNNHDNNNKNCIKELLNVILVLQQSACGDSCLDSCDRPTLGGGPNCLVCNTRPVMLYTCCGNGEPWRMPTSKDATESTDTSSVFRVEKIDGNCCTFRVLENNPDTTSLNPYVPTNSFFTMDCDCLCACRCLNDTYIDCN